MKKLAGLVKENQFIEEIVRLDYNYASEQFRRYNEVIQHVYGREPGEGAPIDNHSHAITVGGHSLGGDSMRLELIAFDVAILGRLGLRNIEFITNRFNNSALKNNDNVIDKIQVSQGLTIKRIPVLQTPVGPVIDKIESIRESNFLIDFRSKIQTETNHENLLEIVSTIEGQFQKYRNDVLIEKQKGSRLVTSLANNALSLIIGAIVPGVGEAKSTLQDIKTRNFSWTGFLAELERKKE